MAVIHVLDKHTAELIAAGEVVERPASVVKELLENSIDAGASQITVSIESGGVKLIEISDNGTGIEAEYISTAFIRHATSKIQTPDDLVSIHTLGFRGEALASIASVARVELTTRTEQDEFATVYCIEGGEELSREPGARAVGTTIRVQDLFYNTPARMKFLKKDSSEGTFVADTVTHVALSHPEVSIKFIREGKLQYVTPGDGQLRGAAYSVLGREFSRDLVEVDNQEGVYHIRGLITPPKSCRASRSMQHFYINGRYVRNRTIMAGMEMAFKGTMMQGKFPGGILLLDMPADLVDVNVHPAKIEVRFANEKPVFDLVYYGVKTAIETGDSVKEATFGGAPAADEVGRAYPPAGSRSAKLDFFRKKEESVQTVLQTAPRTDFWQTAQAGVPYRTAPQGQIPVQRAAEQSAAPTAQEPAPVKVTEINALEPQAAPVVQREQELPAQAPPAVPTHESAESAAAAPPSTETAPAPTVQVVDEDRKTPAFRVVGEAFKTYILVEIENNLYYIDKHAAHERMNFEALRRSAEIHSQLLLAPVTVRLNKAELSAVEEHLDLLQKGGFEVEIFGTDAVLVRSVPAMLDGANIADLICEIAEKLLEHKTDIEPEKLDWIFHSTACRAAVKAGDVTSPAEQRLFVEKLLSMPDIRYCPHGRPVMIKVSRYEIERQFGRA